MDDKELEKLAEKMLAQPKTIEVDGQKVENQSVGDILEVAKYFASKQATSGTKCPIRIARMKCGGAL